MTRNAQGTISRRYNSASGEDRHSGSTGMSAYGLALWMMAVVAVVIGLIAVTLVV